jgi:hypothetical protein
MPANAENSPQRIFVTGHAGVVISSDSQQTAPVPNRETTQKLSSSVTGFFHYQVGRFRVEGVDPFQTGGVLPVAWFTEALAYLEQVPLMQSIIQSAEEHGTLIKMVFAPTNHDIYDRNENVIVWNPTQALAAAEFNGALQSPAMGLGHEFAHAGPFQQTPVAASDAAYTPDWRYDNLEEAHATAIERLTAAVLGEPLRISHRGIPVRVTGPLDRLLSVWVRDPLSGRMVEASVAPQYRFAVSQILDPTGLFVGSQYINPSYGLDAAGNVLDQSGAQIADPNGRPGWNLIKDAAGAYSLSPRPDYLWNTPFDIRAIPAMAGGVLGHLSIDNIELLLGTSPQVAVSDAYRLLIPGGTLTISGNNAPADIGIVVQRLTEAGFADISTTFTHGTEGAAWEVKATKP